MRRVFEPEYYCKGPAQPLLAARLLVSEGRTARRVFAQRRLPPHLQPRLLLLPPLPPGPLQYKPDMQTCKLLKKQHPGWHVWQPFRGHPPGVEVGANFEGRCEMAAAGVHDEYM